MLGFYVRKLTFDEFFKFKGSNRGDVDRILSKEAFVMTFVLQGFEIRQKNEEMSHGSCNESALREESLFHFLFLDFTFLGDRDFKMDKWNLIIYIKKSSDSYNLD